MSCGPLVDQGVGSKRCYCDSDGTGVVCRRTEPLLKSWVHNPEGRIRMSPSVGPGGTKSMIAFILLARDLSRQEVFGHRDRTFSGGSDSESVTKEEVIFLPEDYSKIGGDEHLTLTRTGQSLM